MYLYRCARGSRSRYMHSRYRNNSAASAGYLMHRCATHAIDGKCNETAGIGYLMHRCATHAFDGKCNETAGIGYLMHRCATHAIDGKCNETAGIGYLMHRCATHAIDGKRNEIAGIGYLIRRYAANATLPERHSFVANATNSLSFSVVWYRQCRRSGGTFLPKIACGEDQRDDRSNVRHRREDLRGHIRKE